MNNLARKIALAAVPKGNVPTGRSRTSRGSDRRNTGSRETRTFGNDDPAKLADSSETGLHPLATIRDTGTVAGPGIGTLQRKETGIDGSIGTFNDPGFPRSLRHS